ncbi:Uncharacterised protein [Brevibacterium casei]|uniref:Uncharacterized protein n=1 Tax=Brevibacterium casei TaxID=33889 RepID=A0A449D7G7_9MICO|nr:hypothetical protein [Brevibacterium casei]VEW13547.1 Uncharacterised protein [Brevibacterium casei]
MAAEKACTALGCSTPIGRSGAKGFCPYHYRRFHKYGDPLHERYIPNLGQCQVDDCSKDAYRKDYCYAHYMKDWRYGTPTPQHPDRWEDLTGRRFGTLTATARRGDGMWELRCDCGNPTTARASALNRGDKLHCEDISLHRRRDDAGYRAAHDRVRRDRGKASEHACTDCGSQAQQWSYDHEDPNECYAEDLSLSPVAYSLDVNHYQPRCIPCHKRFDLGRIDAATA